MKKPARKGRLYKCGICGFAYADQKTAAACEKWCKEHHSCNIEIVRKAVQKGSGGLSFR